MKMIRLCIKSLAYGLVLSITATGIAGASQPLIPASFDVVTETEPYPVIIGPVKVALHITPKHQCDEMSVSVEADHMICNSPTLVNTIASRGKSTTISWDVVIPRNDTCGLVFVIDCGKYRHKVKSYWITVGDSIRTFPGNPRLSIIHDYRQDSITVPAKNTTRRHSGDARKTKVDSLGNTIRDSL